mmetsp:Transcript_14604/g.43619  ORF Transcript_14604/g.43619 Transcript_14604/m.43619 type:complete len:456 (-) Transcript_14604:27-1394(-)
MGRKDGAAPPARSKSVLQKCRAVLCGDLGGTNSRLELFRVGEAGTADASWLKDVGKARPLFRYTYKNAEVDGDFTSLLHRFLEDAQLGPVTLAAGCLAVAGPVADDKAALRAGSSRRRRASTGRVACRVQHVRRSGGLHEPLLGRLRPEPRGRVRHGALHHAPRERLRRERVWCCHPGAGRLRGHLAPRADRAHGGGPRGLRGRRHGPGRDLRDGVRRPLRGLALRGRPRGLRAAGPAPGAAADAPAPQVQGPRVGRAGHLGQGHRERLRVPRGRRDEGQGLRAPRPQDPERRGGRRRRVGGLLRQRRVRAGARGGAGRVRRRAGQRGRQVAALRGFIHRGRHRDQEPRAHRGGGPLGLGLHAGLPGPRAPGAGAREDSPKARDRGRPGAPRRALRGADGPHRAGPQPRARRGRGGAGRGRGRGPGPAGGHGAKGRDRPRRGAPGVRAARAQIVG